ncbi:MAG TPA: Lrp/AsnC family transcriptional regulator [Gammaproteobacteria bacterium]|nr:Lrp/AsnC family transcriptional regulator [Gammaproteobacteria bacterium]
MLDATDRRIVNLLQDGIAVCERPFADAGAVLELDEAELIDRLRAMLDCGLLTRFGPMFDAERLGGAFTLCAMRVPRHRFEEITEIVNAFDEVAHNYEREHQLNMWFVIGAGSPERVTGTIAAIEQATGLDVINLPKLEEFYVGLRLEA